MVTALASLHQDLQDLVGRTIADRYRVDDLLGIGGMGAVFRGHHLGLERDVAIKVLHPSLSRDPDISGRFDREARSASRLDHVNCLQVTDYGTTEHGMKFMVMQLLEGGELGKLLGKPLPSMRAISLTLQICRGLEHAHAQGVIHRDIKPENVFITRDHNGQEVLKLVDFGIAKIMTGPEGTRERGMTRAGLVFGTPAYMSPEQAAGVEADERADLYSLGVLLYEMLAGRTPFQSDDPVALVRMQVSADPPRLPQDVPPVLAAIVERSLAKQRADRFQSAKEMRETLEGVQLLLRGDSSPSMEFPLPTVSSEIRLGASMSTMPPSRPIVVRPPKRRLAVGAGAAAIGLLMLWAIVPSDAEPEATAADATPAAAIADPEPAKPGAGADEIAIAVEGPGAAALDEIDRLLLSGKLDDADKLLSPLRDQYPKDAQLAWRQGRLLAKRKNKKAQALAAYGAAIDSDPRLLDDHDFYAELHELLRNPALRDDALDLALQRMGRYGHKFLLELVNNEKKPLSYDDRHRALDELATDPANAELVNHRLNTGLDLRQASSSLAPCKAYGDALAAVVAAPDYYYYPRVEKAVVPKTAAPGTAHREDPAACEGLEQRRQSTLDLLATLAPADTSGDTDGAIIIEDDEPAPAPAKAPAKKPAAKKPAAKKKKPATQDCDKFGGIFKKKCWKQ